MSRRIIDLHAHLSHDMPHEPKNTPLNRSDLAFIFQQYQRAGIICGGFSTFESFYSVESICDENHYLHTISKSKDDVFQWVVIDPRQEQTFAQAETFLSHPSCLGIKIHPYMHQYNTMEYAEMLFSFAEKHKTFILTHPDSPELLSGLVPFADKYPNAKLIIAHLGSVEHIEAVYLAKNHNIFVDTSGIASSKNNIIEYAVSRIGSKNIFFGTDSYSAAFQRGRIEFSGISELDKENIFINNAMREFSQFHSMPIC